MITVVKVITDENMKNEKPLWVRGTEGWDKGNYNPSSLSLLL